MPPPTIEIEDVPESLITAALAARAGNADSSMVDLRIEHMRLDPADGMCLSAYYNAVFHRISIT